MKKLLTVFVFFMFFVITVSGCKKLKELMEGEATAEEQVVVDLHVMSQCPFGVKAEDAFRPVAEKLGPALDLNLHFIGNVNPDGSFRSLHGESEIKGNLMTICAEKYYPGEYWDFLSCLNKNYRKIPANFEECANETNVDYGKLKECVEGDEGKKMLKKSFEYSSKKGAKGSPTIFINGKKHTGGRSESQLMRAVCAEYKEAVPEECQNIPQPKKIKMTVLTDKRCKECGKRVSGITRSLKSRFEGLESEKVFYEDNKGKELYEKMKEKGYDKLPIFLMDKAVKESEGYANAKRWLVPAGDKIIVRAPAKFDPTAEICDNQKDDTGNGLVDCEDPDCKGTLVCREPKKNKLDLFVMSMCPYGTKALDAVDKVLEVFGKNIDLDIYYIGNEKNGKLTSMKGQSEVDENIRQLCAMKYYPKNHKYMEYITCRNKNIRSPKWKSCAKDGIKPEVIEKCSTGEEGKKLFAESLKVPQKLGFGASPTWLANNKHKFSGIDANRVQQMFCRYNPENPGCEKKIEKDKEARKVKGSCG